MKLQRLNNEHLLYLLAFFLALGLRLVLLGAMPLSDYEAGWALQAMHLVTGGADAQPAQIGPQPAYIILSSALFALFGSSNLLARLLPALIGGLVVFVPYCLSRPNQPHLFTQKTALILAIGLALSPALVVTSRLAGGPIMAVSFLLLAIGFLYVRQPAFAGIMAALALLSGPAVIFGILGLAISALAAWYLCRPTQREVGRISTDNSNGSPEPVLEQVWEHPTYFPYPIHWKPALLSGLITILLVGTFLFRYPQGLAGWYETLPSFLVSWVTASGVPASRVLSALVFYAPIAVLFGILGALRVIFRKPDREQRFVVLLSIAWIVIALILVVLNPGRQVSDLVWVIVPLITLAAWEFSFYLPGRHISPVAVAQAIVTGILVGYLWLVLANLTRIPPQTVESMTRFLIIGLIFVMIGLITALVSIGWSWKVARLGLVWGLLAALGLYSISNITGASYLRPNQPQELWGTGPAVGSAKLLTETVAQFSSWNTGRSDSIDLVSEVDTPALRWLFRNYPNAQFVNAADRQSLPSILITTQAGQAPELAALYRGQDFTWRIYPGWQGALPENFISWLTFRDAPLGLEKIILWVRSDIFPGS